MSVTKAKQKSAVHARVFRADGSVESLKYLSGGGMKGKTVRFWRQMKGALNG